MNLVLKEKAWTYHGPKRELVGISIRFCLGRATECPYRQQPSVTGLRVGDSSLLVYPPPLGLSPRLDSPPPRDFAPPRRLAPSSHNPRRRGVAAAASGASSPPVSNPHAAPPPTHTSVPFALILPFSSRSRKLFSPCPNPSANSQFVPPNLGFGSSRHVAREVRLR